MTCTYMNQQKPLNIPHIQHITKLLDLINEFQKVTGYTINIQKSVWFLYINNKQPEKEIKKSNLIYFCKSSNKIPKMNLTKEIKDLYTENYKTLLNENKGDTDKWKYILCSWIGRT